MLHHGPNHNHLVMHAVGGLGNRALAVISAAFMLYKGYYKSITIAWHTSYHCSINMHEILELDADYELNSYVPPIDGMCYQYHRYTTMKSDGVVASNIVAWYDPYASIVEWAKTSPMLRWKLKDDEKVLQADLGIHCRRSDWGYTVPEYQSVEIEGLNLLISESFLDHIITTRDISDIFMASDSPKTVRAFKDKIPHLKAYPKHYDDFTDSYRDRIMMDEAIYDLTSLSKCKTIIRDSGSTFSFLASIIGNNELVTWSRPYLNNCGGGFPDHHINM